jgi:hypothetical protein
MTKFMFEATRSNEKAHQAVGIRCSMCVLGGEIDGPSVNAVYAIVQKLLVVPGVWHVQIRNADPDCQWKPFVPIDTRTPEQIPYKMGARRKPV